MFENEKTPVVQCLLFDEDGHAVSENEALYTLPKYFPFTAPHLSVECQENKVVVSSDVFCPGVELSAGDTRFSDNWFPLYPGEAKTVFADRELIPGQVIIRCLSDGD